MSRDELETLYKNHCARSFPPLGVELGSLVIYDATIAGLTSRAIKGEVFPEIAVPDAESQVTDEISRLRELQNPAPAETQLVNYFDGLQELRAAILEGQARA